MKNLAQMQAYMAEHAIDGWLVYDFQNANPIMIFLLDGTHFLSRRIFLWIPQTGEPVLVGSKIDNDSLQKLPYPKQFYVSWQEMEGHLEQLLTPCQCIAVDYVPQGTLPNASRIDAGTLKMVRRFGTQIVSSADLFQTAAAVWNEVALETHLADCRFVAQVKDQAFDLIANSLHAKQPVTEYQVQQFILDHFNEADLEPFHPPIVAVNAHSSDPHYGPTATDHAPIEPDDWVLIDLWARTRGEQHAFADMTWVGVASAQPTAEQTAVFNAVIGGRDGAVNYLREVTAQGQTAQGWQVDDVARRIITEAGYGPQFIHRTGHSLGPGPHIHGMGANIDNLETHDTRALIPGIGFSIEPGIYLPGQFGIRSEINVYMAADGPLITTPVQHEIICLM